MSMVSTNANQILRDLRIKQGWSHVELAKRMGLNTGQHQANLEYGTNRLTLELAYRASKALSVPVSVFLTHKDKQNV